LTPRFHLELGRGLREAAAAVQVLSPPDREEGFEGAGTGEPATISPPCLRTSLRHGTRGRGHGFSLFSR